MSVTETNKSSTSTAGKQYEIKTKDTRRRRRYVHPCRLCGRLFRRPCEVKQHLLSHGGAKPYQCRDCGKRFGSKSGAGIHALKQHGKDVSVENIIDVCHIPLEDVAISLTPATLKEVASHVKGNSDKTEGDSGQSDSSSSSDDDFEWKMDEDVFDIGNEEKEGEGEGEGEGEVEVESGEALLSTNVEKEDSNGNVTKDEPSSENDGIKEDSNDNVPFVTVEPKLSRPKTIKRKTESSERKRNNRGGAKEKKPKKRDPFPKPPKHECTICGKMWRTMSEFKSHVATHSDERPFICEICGQAYKHKAALDIHVGMHNGINPFSCPFCNKAFTQKGALQRHLPIHTGEAPFQV